MSDRDDMRTEARTGTQTKTGEARGPVAGDDALNAQDVAPKRGRATGVLILAAVIIAVVVIAGLFFASEAPDLSSLGRGMGSATI